MVVVVAVFKYYKHRKKLKEMTMIIKNAMIVPVCIGSYDDRDNIADAEFNGYVQDLDGISNDIDHCLDLFGTKLLNYDIYPCYDDQKVISHKNYWTKSDLINFLRYQADHLEAVCNDGGIQYKYDGLVVVISGHGITDQNEECVITSDYKLISKLEIHRTFGSKPGLRNIPRIFLFDCCSGDKDRDSDWRAESYDDESESSEPESEAKSDIDHGKGVSDERRDSGKWYYGENNPDFKLFIINAANKQFQSKMSIATGSYVITQLTQLLMDNITDNNKKFLQEILRTIQDYLHNRGKQLIEFTANNGTGYIKFTVNTRENEYFKKIKPQNISELDSIENKLECVLIKYIGDDEKLWKEKITKSKELIDKIEKKFDSKQNFDEKENIILLDERIEENDCKVEVDEIDDIDDKKQVLVEAIMEEVESGKNVQRKEEIAMGIEMTQFSNIGEIYPTISHGVSGDGEALLTEAKSTAL